MAKKSRQKPSAAPPKTWPADRVVRLAVDKLLPYARNARLHTESQVAQLARAIERYGFTNPVIVDQRGEIIAGHGRVMAAQLLKLKQVPGVVIGDGEWTEADRKAYRIWDNQSGLISEWQPENLRFELKELKAADYDLTLIGFEPHQLGWFTSDDVVLDAGSQWGGMPAFDHDEKRAFRTIVVHFLRQEDVEAFARLVNQNVTEDTKFLWFPPVPEERYVDKKYEQAAE